MDLDFAGQGLGFELLDSAIVVQVQGLVSLVIRVQGDGLFRPRRFACCVAGTMGSLLALRTAMRRQAWPRVHVQARVQG